MKLKTLVIVVVVLAVISAGVYVMNRPATRPPADPRVGQPVVSTDAVEKAAKIKISDQGKSVLLVRQPDATWRVASYYDFPADFQKLSTFVNELTSAKIDQFVTRSPEKIARLEFKDTQIALLDAADKPNLELTLGKNAEAGGRFLRYDNEARAYRATLNAWLDTDPKSWADATLLSVKPEEVAKVEISFPNAQPVVATRAKKGDAFTASDAPAGKKLRADRVDSVLSSLGSLRFSDTSELSDPKALAAKQNARSVKITTFDGKTYTVSLGRKPEEKIVKPPKPAVDAKGGLSTVDALAKAVKDADKPAAGPAEAAKPTPTPTKLPTPEVETIPAGPVFVEITAADPNAPINALMKKRAFQVYEYAFTSLPQNRDEVFEPIPTPTPAPSATPTPTGASASAAAAPTPTPTATPIPTPPAPK